MHSSTAHTLPWPILNGITATWRRLTLVRQFALIGLVVIGSGTFTIGAWVAQRIEVAVVRNSAVSAALYMGSLVEPIVQDIGADGQLSPEQTRRLDELFSSSLLGKHIVSIKIWVNGAKIAYSTHKEVVGQQFELVDSLKLAWGGTVAGEYNQLIEAENAIERRLDVPLLEIYAPLRKSEDGAVIAVGEFYDRAEHLRSDLAAARRASWLVVSLGGLGMFAALYGLVRQAGNTIDRQQLALRDRIAQLSQALSSNEILAARVEDANRRSVVLNDRFLRRVGAELHDGPAQLLALALLRLDTLLPGTKVVLAAKKSNPPKPPDVEILRKVLGDALTEIRNLSGGLSLPEVRTLTLGQTLLLCAQSHERRTGTSVTCQIDPAPAEVSTAVKICLYRFAQEGLNNAFRHAAGGGQKLLLSVADRTITVEVTDAGPGFDASMVAKGDRLGLPGLRDRIVSLGGTFDIQSQPGKGSRLIARFSPVAEDPRE